MIQRTVIAKTGLLIFLMVTNAVGLFAQEDPEVFKPKIRGAIMMANSHVPKATIDGKKIAVIPTWGFDVDYFFHSRWSIAIQGDIKIESFEVEDGAAELQRSNPVAVAALIHFHMVRHWSFYAGPGYELESHKNLPLYKIGSEYSFEVNENFEIALNLIYENKEGVYDGWVFGVAFNKKLWEKK